MLRLASHFQYVHTALASQIKHTKNRTNEQMTYFFSFLKQKAKVK